MSISFSYVRSEMIDTKVYSLLKVNECGSFAAAAKHSRLRSGFPFWSMPSK